MDGSSSFCPRCRVLEARVAALEAQVAELAAALEAAQRAAKRQAAPFSKGAPKRRAKKPGRKPGDAYGTQHCRAVPLPEAIDETHEAPLPLACPECGSRRIQKTGVVVQYQTEIPRRPIQRRFHVHLGTCTGCGKSLQGRHRLQTSDALGAAASQLGPDAHAAMAWLNKQLGLSHGKVSRLFTGLFGIKLARSTSARSIQRTARRCQPAHGEIRCAVRASPSISCDETGWRVGGRGAWLHAWVGQHATCYAIDGRRGADVLAELLGWDWGGLLVHDGWAPYERFAQARHQQCLAHVLRRCRALLETATGGAVRFPRAVIALLRQALRLRDRHAAGALSEDALAEGGLRCAVTLARLTARRRSSAANERLALHLDKHLWQWFWFLFQPGIDATNWRAEQALRPAVVNRKVWGGNRTWRGAWAQTILMSVLQTCHQQARDDLAFLSHALRSPAPVALLEPVR